MGRFHYRIERLSTASPERVFDVLYDAPGWRRWAPLIGFAEWVDPDVVGVGAVRRIGSRGILNDERITVHEPPLRHGYTLLAQKPARDYQALVTLQPAGTGTRIIWEGSFEPDPPLLGRLYGRFIKRFLSRLASALAREAERIR